MEINNDLRVLYEEEYQLRARLHRLSKQAPSNIKAQLEILDLLDGIARKIYTIQQMAEM